MQPYFFPYLGHFSLIAAVDQWVVFDISQYTKKDWMNRNRILHPHAGWQYITVPVRKHALTDQTRDIHLCDRHGTAQRILAQLAHYKNKAPYFAEVSELVHNAFAAMQTDSLVALNVHGLKQVCDYLGLPFRYIVCSDLNLTFDRESMKAGDWAPEIARALQASEYINPVSGACLFDPARFTQYGIKLLFMRPHAVAYPVAPYQFEPYLSILDVLMWQAPGDVLRMIKTARDILTPDMQSCEK